MMNRQKSFAREHRFHLISRSCLIQTVQHQDDVVANWAKPTCPAVFSNSGSSTGKGVPYRYYVRRRLDFCQVSGLKLFWWNVNLRKMPPTPSQKKKKKKRENVNVAHLWSSCRKRLRLPALHLPAVWLLVSAAAAPQQLFVSLFVHPQFITHTQMSPLFSTHTLLFIKWSHRHLQTVIR